MSEYPKYAPLGWPFEEVGFWAWAGLPDDLDEALRNMSAVHAYIDWLRAEGRGDEVPEMQTFNVEVKRSWGSVVVGEVDALVTNTKVVE